jgi:DNA-binding CsgD family transcriptional regulator
MSARDAVDQSPDALTDDLEAVADALEVEWVDIFATVIRVTPAIRLAVRRPDLVRRMVLSSPFTAGESSAPGFVPMIEKNWNLFVRMMASSNIDRGGDLEHRVEFMNQCFDQRNIAAQSNAALAFEDWSIAERVQCPVLILDDRGSLAVEGHTAAFAERFPTGHLVTAPVYHVRQVPSEVFDFLDEPDDGCLRPSSYGAPQLTNREREVLTHLAAGRTQREIAAALVISPATVSRHVVSLYSKLGVHRRAEAVAWAIRNGVE